MITFLDKAVLFILCYLIFAYGDSSTGIVISCLVSVSISGLSQICRRRKTRLLCFAVYILAGIRIPQVFIFLPMVTYDMVSIFFGELDQSVEEILGAYLYPVLSVMLLLVSLLGAFYSQFAQGVSTVWGIRELLIFILLMILAGMLSYRSRKEHEIANELISQRDSSTELNLMLKEKNRELLEGQDSQIHIATLSERNRIAREIHDNVGHMLSRCILQMGALLVVHKEEPLHEQLAGVNETLNEAMTSIRKSVHDLHDESVDVKHSVEEILKPLHDSYVIDFQYDLSMHVEKEVKYCFINVIKEATTNIVKHSDATKISLILREQPAFYQLSIEDDGHPKQQTVDSPGGIGLQNMRERVESLHGIFRCTGDSGFRIFISIPKKSDS